MPKYYSLNDSIEGEKIYCVFETSKGPARISTRGRHNAQGLTINGNPATAVILKTLGFVKD